MWTIDRIKKRYRELRPDGHWFDRDTMRYHGTLIDTGSVREDREGNVLFLTQENDFSGENKFWHVRCFDPRTGEISRLNGFCEHQKHSDAMKFLMVQTQWTGKGTDKL